MNFSESHRAKLHWQWSSFSELSPHEVYAILALRQDIFVLEQQSLYRDIDGHDVQSAHLLGWQHNGAERVLVAYLRCVPPGILYPQASLGRVMCARSARGMGLGRQVFSAGVLYADQHYPGQGLRISAQQYLESFYASFGFTTTSSPYQEDGIWHVDMLRDAVCG